MRAPLPTLLLVAACTSGKESACGETGGLACFADASDEQLIAAANAGIGLNLVLGWLMAGLAYDDATFNVDDPCPAASGEDDTLTLEAMGCIGEVTGARWTGALDWTNPPTGTVVYEDDEETGFTLSSDPSQPTELVYRELALWTEEPDGERVRQADGTISVGAATENPYTLAADLRYTVDEGPAARQISEQSCAVDADGATACADLSPRQGEVDGLGSFTATDELDADGVVIAVELAGADTLRIEAADDSGCIQLADRVSYCSEDIFPQISNDDDPVDEDDATLLLWGIGAESGSEGTWLDLHAVATPGVSGVEVALIDTADEALGVELHALADEDGDDQWAALVRADDAYASGESSAFPSADLDFLVGQFRVYDADGALVGCAYEAVGALDPEDWFDTAACPTLE